MMRTSGAIRAVNQVSASCLATTRGVSKSLSLPAGDMFIKDVGDITQSQYQSPKRLVSGIITQISLSDGLLLKSITDSALNLKNECNLFRERLFDIPSLVCLILSVNQSISQLWYTADWYTADK